MSSAGRTSRTSSTTSCPSDPEWEKVPAGLREFYEDPEKHPLADAQRQARVLLPAAGRPLPRRQGARPATQVGGKQRVSRRADRRRAGQGVPAPTYEQPRPLAHPRPERRHQLAAGDQDLQDQGLGRLPLRAHLDQPQDAAARGIKDGDIVKLFNERGTVLGAACLGKDHARSSLHGPRRPRRPHQRRLRTVSSTAAGRTT